MGLSLRQPPVGINLIAFSAFCKPASGLFSAKPFTTSSGLPPTVRREPVLPWSRELGVLQRSACCPLHCGVNASSEHGAKHLIGSRAWLLTGRLSHRLTRAGVPPFMAPAWPHPDHGRRPGAAGAADQRQCDPRVDCGGGPVFLGLCHGLQDGVPVRQQPSAAIGPVRAPMRIRGVSRNALSKTCTWQARAGCAMCSNRAASLQLPALAAQTNVSINYMFSINKIH